MKAFILIGFMLFAYSCIATKDSYKMERELANVITKTIETANQTRSVK